MKIGQNQDMTSDIALPEPARLEREAAALWCEVLSLSSIPDGANFFELGGNSLLLLGVFIRIEERWGLYVEVDDVLNDPTIRGFAAAMLKAGVNSST